MHVNTDKANPFELDHFVGFSIADPGFGTALDVAVPLFNAAAQVTPADEDSVSHLCEISEKSPHTNTILHYLRTKFELEELERVGKTLIRQDILALLPDRPMKVVADLHLRPYYGEEYELKRNSTTHSLNRNDDVPRLCHALRPRRNKRYTLAVRRLTDVDTARSILAELLGVLDGLDLEVKAVYLDREFYDTYCLTLLTAHNYAFVMPIVKWGEKIQNELSTGWSRVIGSVASLYGGGIHGLTRRLML